MTSFVGRHFVSLALSAAAVLLGGYLYFVDSGRVTTSESEARKRNLLKAYRRAEISEIVLRQGETTTRMTRRAGDAGDAAWTLDNGAPADQPSVDKLLGALEFATPERRVTDADRASMGLQAPRASLTLSMGRVNYRLDVGAAAPTPPGAVYAELEGEGTFVIGRDLATELTRSPDAYRGRTIVPYLASALSAIELTGAGAHRRLVRAAGGGGWSLVRGDAKVLVDRDASNRLLSALAEVRAEAFPSEIEGERALAEASSKVRLTLVPQEPAGPRAVIDIGGACPGHPEDVVAVRSEPAPKMVACVPQGVVPALSVSAEQLIDLHLFALRPDEMEEIELVAGEKKIDIVRAGPAWHMRAPTEGNVDNDVGQLFARGLHDVVAEAIVTPGTPGIGLDRVRATAKIGKVDGGDDPSAFEKVEAGPEMGDGFVYVRRATDGAILKVASEAARALVPQSSSLRSRKIIDEATSRVRGVVIDGPAVQQTLRRTPNGGYSLEAPKGFAVDPGLANDVAEALAQLKAERFAADADDGSFAFARPRAKYRLELEGPKVIDVETGRSTADGVFARRVGDPAVFVLPQATVRVLDTWAVDRSYFMLDPREVRQVKIERGTERVTLVAPSGKDAGPGAQRFDIVRNAFAAARTEGVLHLGPPRKDEGFDAPLMVLVITKGAEGSSETKVVRFAIGRGDVWRDTSVFYLRREGVDATFVMAQSKLRPLLDAK